MMSEEAIKKKILVSSILGSFITPYIISSINVAIPHLGREFQLSTSAMNWIVLSLTLFMAVFILPFGRLADIYGRKKLLLLGISVFTLASLFCGLSVNIIMLIAFRILQGTSAGMVSVTVISLLSSAYSREERGKVLGISVAATYIGLSSGPFLGGVLTKYLGWRSIFFLVVPMGIVLILLLSSFREDWVEAKEEPFDLKGSLIYSSGLFGVVGGLSLIQHSFGLSMIVLGIVLMFIFVIYEKRVKSPILDINLFKVNRVLFFSSLAALINYSATFVISYLLSLYLQFVKGLDPQQAGLVLISQPFMQALFSPLAGSLSDRIEPQVVASLGMAVTTLGLGLLIFLEENSSLFYIVFALFIVGFGFALFSSPNTNAVLSSVSRKYYGVASGILGSARTVGQALSMAITSLVMVIYMGNISISRDYHPGFLESVKVTFLILTILCFLGIFASIARGKTKVN
ncbi:MAG: MFS transporter [Candidatus Caldatribacteriota bacterium]